MKLNFFPKVDSLLRIPARSSVGFLCILLLFVALFSACKKKSEGPDAPDLIRLVELIQDPATEIDSHVELQRNELQPLQENGWELGQETIKAVQRRSAFILPQWLWKSKDFRMKFRARSVAPRELMIHVQGKEIGRHHLTSEWKEYFIQYSSSDLKKPTVKQIQFVFGGSEAPPFAEFQSFQLPLYSWGRTRISQEIRTALSVNSKSKVRFHLKLPEKKPYLFFGIGVPVEKGPPALVEYSVRIDRKNKTSELLKKTVKFPQPYAGWQDERIDLSKHAGEEVTLEIQTTSSSPKSHYVAWSSPEIYDVSAEKNKPNIILLSIDTMRADRLSDRLSPNLMKFARESERFTNAYCTFPSTLPSHTSVMTGLYVANHQVSRPAEEIVRVKQIPHTLPTLAELAAQGGYFTAGITDGGFVSSFFGFDRGFQQYSDNIHMARKDVATISNALRWLKTNSQRPFFLFLHSYEVHEPFNPPVDAFRKLFPKPALNRPPVITMDYLHRIVSGAVVPTEEQKEFIRQCYDAEIYFFDQNFGRLLAEIKQLGLEQDTVILVFADHGELFLEDRNPFGHGKTLIQEEIQVPLILHVPGRKPAERNDIVSLVDIFPTLAQMMGSKVDFPIDGIDLLEPADSKKRFNRSVYYEVNYGKEAMWGTQTREFKLVLDKQKGAEFFYDLRKDPGQKNNLSTTDTRSLQMMKKVLAAYVQKSTSPTEWAKAKQEKQETNELREQLKALGYIN
jgi:arylsulfatase A-like enzyme